MHITIASDALADALKTSVAASKTTMPILAQARIATTDDGRVSFLTTDLEAYVETFSDAVIHEAGAQCLQASLLRPVVAKDGDITIRGDVLTRGRSRYRVPGYPVADYPLPESVKAWAPIDIDVEALAYAVTTVGYAVTSDNPRPEFRAVIVAPGIVWGTTGNRGARVGIDYSGPSLAIPGHPAERLVAALVPGAKLSTGNMQGTRAGLLRVASQGQILTLRLLDIAPIDFLRATPLPDESRPSMTFRTDHVRNLVRRFLPFTEVVGTAGKFLSVELVNERGEIILTDRSGDNRESLTDALVSVTGAFRSGLNPRFLLDALVNVKSERVVIVPGDATQRVNFAVIPEPQIDGREELHMFAGLVI